MLYGSSRYLYPARHQVIESGIHVRVWVLAGGDCDGDRCAHPCCWTLCTIPSHLCALLTSQRHDFLLPDPVAVVAVLRELGAPPRLSMLVEGESLLNDGSAVMLFLIFKELVEDRKRSYASDCRRTGPRIHCGGRLGSGGFLIGYVTYQWMRAFDDTTVDITCLIIGVFATFYVAEHIMHVSEFTALVVWPVSG